MAAASSAPAAPAAGGPPPPPPGPPPPALPPAAAPASEGPGLNTSALFADLNKGESVTSGKFIVVCRTTVCRLYKSSL